MPAERHVEPLVGVQRRRAQEYALQRPLGDEQRGEVATVACPADADAIRIAGGRGGEGIVRAAGVAEMIARRQSLTHALAVAVAAEVERQADGAELLMLRHGPGRRSRSGLSAARVRT